MSEAYDRFLMQHQAKGKEYGEGYDRSHFDGLTPEELATVEDMLVREALAHDSVATRGLGVPGTRRSEDILRAILATVRPPSYTHLRAAGALREITREQALQQIILEDCTGDAELRRPAFIGLLCTDPSPLLLKVCRDMLRTEGEGPVMRTLAAGGVLQCYGLMKS